MPSLTPATDRAARTRPATARRRTVAVCVALAAAAALGSQAVTAQAAAAPDRVTLSPTATPSTSQTVT